MVTLCLFVCIAAQQLYSCKTAVQKINWHEKKPDADAAATVSRQSKSNKKAKTTNLVEQRRPEEEEEDPCTRRFTHKH